MAEIFTILTLDVDKKTNLTMTDVYQDIANVTMSAPTVIDGWYEFMFSLTSTYDSTTKSEHLRFSTDGGIAWTEFLHEPSDKTDNEPFFYAFPKLYTTAEAVNFIVQARKQDAANIMIVSFSDAWIRRIG